MTSINDTPSWFDASYYLQNKLKQMRKIDPTYTMQKLTSTLNNAGYQNPYDHYIDYGISEGLNPNSLYNEDYYIQKKLDQLGPQWTEESLLQTIKDAGLTCAANHYAEFGWKEDINPSALFDNKTYLEVKNKQLLQTDPSWTVERVKDAFDAAGLSPLEHYMLFADKEGTTQDTWASWLDGSDIGEKETPWDVNIDYSYNEESKLTTTTVTTIDENGGEITVTVSTSSINESVATETTEVKITGVQSVESIGDAMNIISDLIGHDVI